MSDDVMKMRELLGMLQAGAEERGLPVGGSPHAANNAANLLMEGFGGSDARSLASQLNTPIGPNVSAGGAAAPQDPSGFAVGMDPAVQSKYVELFFHFYEQVADEPYMEEEEKQEWAKIKAQELMAQ
jgi:hypothetical protein